SSRADRCRLCKIPRSHDGPADGERTMSIVVVGSLNLDIVAYGPRLPKPGETIHGDRYTLGLGGKGANQAAATARLGNDVTMVGRVGADAFGEQVLTALAGFGTDVSCVLRDREQSTSIAVIGVDAKGENTINVIG